MHFSLNSPKGIYPFKFTELQYFKGRKYGWNICLSYLRSVFIKEIVLPLMCVLHGAVELWSAAVGSIWPDQF